MLEKVNLEKVLFLDIETAPQTYKIEDLDEAKKNLFISKTRFIHHGEEDAIEKAYNDRSSIFAEFGKIICISVGFVHTNSIGEKQIRMKSFYHDDEETLLHQFVDLLNDKYLHLKEGRVLCLIN